MAGGMSNRPIGLEKTLGFMDANRGITDGIVSAEVLADCVSLRYRLADLMRLLLPSVSCEKDCCIALTRAQKADYIPWKYAYDINNIRAPSTERLMHSGISIPMPCG